jgi:hypothetical protein
VNAVAELHKYVGFCIPAGFTALMLWTIISLVRNKAPKTGFWVLLGILQVVIGVQFLVGGALFVSGARPATEGPDWLHYVYGALFPAFVLTIAHGQARKHSDIPWVIFGIAAFLCAASTFRAIQTGLGMA